MQRKQISAENILNAIIEIMVTLFKQKILQISNDNEQHITVRPTDGLHLAPTSYFEHDDCELLVIVTS